MTDATKCESVPSLLLSLTDGFSKHASIATKYWLSLSIVSILALIPTNNKAELSLPFIGQKTTSQEYYPFAAALISLLVISFGVAQCQLIRTRKYIQRFIKDYKEKCNNDSIFDIQDIFDSIVSPSMFRIAPLSQILFGKHQFYPEAKKVSCPIRSVAFVYYMVLACVRLLIMTVFPAYALIMCFTRGQLFDQSQTPWGLSIYFFWLTGMVSLLILVQVLILDIMYSFQSCKHIFASHEKDK